MLGSFVTIGAGELMMAVVVLVGFILTTVRVMLKDFWKDYKKQKQLLRNIAYALDRAGIKVRNIEGTEEDEV